MSRDEVLRAWARENGYCVRVAIQVPLDQLGGSTRMFFGSMAGATVFHVFLEHRGRGRRGWVLCRDTTLRGRANRVKVRWDETVAETFEWEEYARLPDPPASSAATQPKIHPLWDRDLDG